MKNFEVKDNLAKLLATENLIVEHKQVPTACFNVESRVLTLPMWNASDNVYDMLVGHEVGHALYTPTEEWKKDKYKNVPPDFVNVVEDARIEKLMKRRYAGLSKSFYKGYKELHVKDFFEIQTRDLSEVSFIDRINLYFKLGAFEIIEFNEKEQAIVDKVKNVETFEEVLELSWEVCEHLKENQDMNLDINIPNTGSHEDLNSGNMDSVEPEDGEDDNETVTGDPEGTTGDIKDEKEKEEEQEETEDIVDGGGESASDEFKSETQEAFDYNQKQLIDNGAQETTYIEFPKVHLDRIVVPCEGLNDYINKFWNDAADDQMRSYYEYDRKVTYRSYNEEMQKEYLQYKKESNKGVNYLVKEFECRKSADAYSRSATSRTGVLDTKKLHTYQFNEDLFKKITVLPEGKNHGLIFILDWSGSMHNVINDTVKQLLNLVWFCKKVNIPFEVYGFTYECPAEWRYENKDTMSGLQEVQEMKEDTLYLNPNFRLLNFLSSTRNAREFDQDCSTLYKISSVLQGHGYQEFVPYGLSLSGTPLNETIVALRNIIPEFFNKNKVSKVNCVLLTDGESCQISRLKKTHRHYEDSWYWGRSGLHRNCQLRDKKVGRVYAPATDWDWKNSVTKTLLENLTDNFPNVNIIGIRLLESRDVSNFHYTYSENQEYDDRSKKSWSKNKSCIMKTTGYSVIYGIAATTMKQDCEFEVKEDATKAQIRSAFKKNLKTKSSNKKVLSSFIEMVA
tara:strand:- start:595 stop:2796 length:2202 start_codon:yes stop_codon:yes gene_type:complete